MKGLQFLLQSFGINIDPAQIELAFQQGQDSLPKIAAAFDELNSRMTRMEGKLELLLSRTSGEVQPDPIHEQVLNGHLPEKILQEVIRGR
jgi:hypothetical protein